MREKNSLFDFLFVKPVFAWLFTALLMVGGAAGYSMMIKESNPDLKLPMATITTEWAGAPPDIIEKEISTEIEKKVKSLKGIKRVRSGSFDSFSVVTVEFEADAPHSESMQLLRAKVSEAEAELPAEAEKPEFKEVSVTDTPVVTFMLYGDVGPAVLGRAADRLRDRLERVDGVREVVLSGQREEVVRVQLDPARLRALGLSPSSVRSSIQSANVDAPLGELELEDIPAVTFKFGGRFDDLARLRSLPVTRLEGGRAVRLDEVADVTRDLEKETDRTFLSLAGERFREGVSVQVVKTPGQDTIRIIEGAVAAVEDAYAEGWWPQGVEYAVLSDQSEFIWESLGMAFDNGWQAMLAVFLILLVVLTWREALIAGLAIPVTFLGTLAVAAVTGNTMNNLLIVGMVLALGMLVDVFILAMEGMHDGIYVQGLRFPDAARNTVKSYAIPAFAGQMTTVLAMVPLFAIGGVDGKFIRTIPLIAVICLLLSFLIAFLSCVPLSRYLLGGRPVAGVTRMDRLAARASSALAGWLDRKALASRRKAVLWVVGAFGLFWLALQAGGTLPSELYGKDDGRNLGITVELAPGTSLERSQEVADRLGEVLRSKDFFQSVVKYVGSKSPEATGSIEESMIPAKDSHIIGFSAVFIPRSERERLGYEYLPALREELETALLDGPGAAPGATLVLTPQTGGSGGGDPVQIDLYGDDMTILRDIAQKVRQRLETVPGATDVRDNLGPTRLDVRFTPKREAMSFHGLTENEVTAQMRIGMANDKVGTFKMPGIEDDLDILLGTGWPSLDGRLGGPGTFGEIAAMNIIMPDRVVPLLSVLDYGLEQASQVIIHKDARRCVTVMSKTEGRTAADILSVMRPVLEEMRGEWPEGYTWGFGGEAEKQGEVYASVPVAAGLALFLVFAVLALIFGNFRQPFIIMFTVPLALTGTLGGFFLFWMPMSFPAMIGIIALVGIVVNNAIVMIETMNAHRRNGLSAREAAARGASDRLRPIVSTTVTTLAGLVPLAVSDPTWRPLCAAIIFGLLTATVFAMVVVPSMYLLITGRETSDEESVQHG